MIEHHGHFRVPEQLASTLAEIAAIYSPKKVIDPCCEDVAILEKCIFAQERRAVFRNPSALRDAEAKKTEVCCELGDITKISLDAVYDVVLTIVPFGARDQTDFRTRYLDVLVAERCVELVASDGVCILVVPQAFLIAQRLSEFRRLLSTLAIDAVIEIPPRALTDLVGIRSAIIVVRRGKPRQCGVFMGTYQPDQGASVVKALREGVGEFFVASDEMKGRWTRAFHDPRQKAMRAELDRLGARPLGEFGEIRMGSIAMRDNYQDKGEYLILTGRHLRQTAIVASEGDRFVDRMDDEWFEKCVIEPGDVVFSLIPPSAYVYKKTDPPAIVGNNVAVLRTDDNEYVSTYLNTPDGRRLFEHQALAVGSSLAGHIRVSVAQLREIRIPVLPLEELNAVSDAAIAAASLNELEALRQQLERTKHELELTRAELEIKRQADNGDVLQTLRFVALQNAKILEQQQVANAKLDHLVAVVGTILVDIGDIKKGSRSDEEKLVRICQKLDTLTEGDTDEIRTIQEYVAVVQSWLDRWSLLDGLTQRFLPSAEQLYDFLEKQVSAEWH